MVKELYKDGKYRVVHGPEEEARFLASGWSHEKPIGVTHRAYDGRPDAPNPAPVDARKAK